MQEPRQPPLIFALRGWRLGSGLKIIIVDGAILMDQSSQ